MQKKYRGDARGEHAPTKPSVTDFADLERIAKAKAVSVYFERRALAEGRPHIHIKTRGMTLASFRNEADAVHWLKGGRP